MKKYLILTIVLFFILISSCRKYEVKIYDNNRVSCVVHYDSTHSFNWTLKDSMRFYYDKNKLDKIDVYYYDINHDTIYKVTWKYSYKTSYIEKEYIQSDTIYYQKLYPNEDGLIVEISNNNKIQMKYEYDENKNLTNEIYSETVRTHYEYNDNNLKSINYISEDRTDSISVKSLQKKSNLNLFFTGFVFYGNNNTNLIDYLYIDTLILQRYYYKFDNENRITQIDEKYYLHNDTIQCEEIKRTKVHY